MARTFHRALITGASSGIGAHIARELAARGVGLVLVARRTDLLEELATELRTIVDSVEVLAADLLEEAGVQVVQDRLLDLDRPIDVLVNNAGMSAMDRFHRIPMERVDGQVRLNSIVPVRLTLAVIERMRVARHGAVLNTSSVASFMPGPKLATYNASKAMLTSWSAALHEEMRGTGVSVTALCPGFTRTDFIGDDGDRIPDRVMSEPQDVARAGVEAMYAGTAIEMPAVQDSAMRAIAKLVPNRLLTRVIAKAF